MKYLKLDEVFIPIGSKEFTITEGDNKTVATKAAMLALALKAYQPMDQGRALSTLEIRSYNRVLDILEGPPQEGGYHRFEDVDYAVLVKVVKWVLPLLLWFRQAPAIEDILDGAVGTLPIVALPAPSPDGVAKDVPEPAAV